MTPFVSDKELCTLEDLKLNKYLRYKKIKAYSLDFCEQKLELYAAMFQSYKNRLRQLTI
jgi:hypothetical protein